MRKMKRPKKPRHVVPLVSGFYYQATPAMRAKGVFSEPLGKDMIGAYTRARFLNEAWDQARDGKDIPRPIYRLGTFGWYVADRIQARAVYGDKAPRTREEFESVMTNHLLPKFGKTPLAMIDAEHCEVYHDALRRRYSLHKVAKVFKWLRYVFNHAVKRQILEGNPALAVEIKMPPARTTIIEEWELRRAIAKAWRTDRAALAVMLTVGYDTTISTGDIRGLRPKDDKGDRFESERKKTGQPIRSPIWTTTRRAIDRYKRRLGYVIPQDGYLFRTITGRPWSQVHFNREVRKLFREVGISDEKQFRDIRRTGYQERVTAGASLGGLAAAASHSYVTAAKMAEVYGPQTLEMAQGAQDKRAVYLKERRRGRENKKGPKV